MITLYLDMDGVLCNFDKAYRAFDPQKNDRKQFREAVLVHSIFENLEFMPDAQELLDYVSKLDNIKVEILTSMGTRDVIQGNAAKYQKTQWLNTHKIPYKANFVTSKQEKANFAYENSILVDDSVGCIDPFTLKGGYGILHTKTIDTIEKLDKTISLLYALDSLKVTAQPISGFNSIDYYA